MDATHCVVDTELDRIYPQQWSGWAEVKTILTAVIVPGIDR